MGSITILKKVGQEFPNFKKFSNLAIQLIERDTELQKLNDLIEERAIIPDQFNVLNTPNKS